MTAGRYARIAGVGSSVPDRVVPNAYFESIVDTSDAHQGYGLGRRPPAAPKVGPVHLVIFA